MNRKKIEHRYVVDIIAAFQKDEAEICPISFVEEDITGPLNDVNGTLIYLDSDDHEFESEEEVELYYESDQDKEDDDLRDDDRYFVDKPSIVQIPRDRGFSHYGSPSGSSRSSTLGQGTPESPLSPKRFTDIVSTSKAVTRSLQSSSPCTALADTATDLGTTTSSHSGMTTNFQVRISVAHEQ
ncbi:hypothetical protein Fot_19401 [Forsythia ovata]|uniref:Uncharacterized protein n=1 Tax=Forsythia ovata TaxID=205694 RepID=A0ABD1VNR2_9LAMI